jgi:D-alanyl-D-alanine dipeptidase
MLYKAKSLLPDGMNLCILCGYRSIEQQRLEWNREFKKQKSLNPLLSDDKIEFIARKIVACPKNGFGPHQTGGAVDVTISNNHGKLDMGGDYVGENPATFSSDITIEQKENRAILYKAMTNAGFVNYPNEWWHYSFGDRAWAAYSSRKFAIYGKI